MLTDLMKRIKTNGNRSGHASKLGIHINMAGGPSEHAQRSGSYRKAMDAEVKQPST